MYGITFAIKDSSVLYKPRLWVTSRSLFLKEMLSCAYCTGFHSGWMSFVLLKFSMISDLPWVPGSIIYAFSGAAASYVIDLAVIFLEGISGD